MKIAIKKGKQMLPRADQSLLKTVRNHAMRGFAAAALALAYAPQVAAQRVATGCVSN
jgi:hypothetical protein